jgi:hypothetical protein
MDRTPVTSSNITAIGYDSESKVMEVAVHDAFMAAASKGYAMITTRLCGRSDDSLRFCVTCRYEVHGEGRRYYFTDSTPQARMVWSDWQTLADGTLMRTGTGV